MYRLIGQSFTKVGALEWPSGHSLVSQCSSCTLWGRSSFPLSFCAMVICKDSLWCSQRVTSVRGECSLTRDTSTGCCRKSLQRKAAQLVAFVHPFLYCSSQSSKLHNLMLSLWNHVVALKLPHVNEVPAASAGLGVFLFVGFLHRGKSAELPVSHSALLSHAYRAPGVITVCSHGNVKHTVATVLHFPCWSVAQVQLSIDIWWSFLKRPQSRAATLLHRTEDD